MSPAQAIAKNQCVVPVHVPNWFLITQYSPINLPISINNSSIPLRTHGPKLHHTHLTVG